jgi:exodeoxyribonuclease-3
MKIATWNVNSIRSRLERLLGYLAKARPDVLCLQELKCTEEQFPKGELEAVGYQSVLWGQKTYNGVAILSLEPASDVVTGLADGDDDTQARLIAATVRGVRVASLYAPNGQSVDSPAYQYKLAYYARLRRYVDQRHNPGEPLVICGDFNVAPEPIDVYDPHLWEGQTLFTVKEREALGHLAAFGLADAFRRHHSEAGRYSWWDYRMLGFPKNRGLRIDHVLATQPLMERCVASDIDREMRKGKLPSDHAPVWADFAWP